MKAIVLAGVFSAFSAAGVLGIMAPARATDESLPVGSILAWGGETGSIPKNWMLCNGRAVSKAVYQELFAAIGTSWGTNGVDKFNLPDLRGRFLRGSDNGTGRDPDVKKRGPSNPGGNATGAGSIQEDSLQNHTHDQTPHYHKYPLCNLPTNIADTGSGTRVVLDTQSECVTLAMNANLLGVARYNTKSQIYAGEENRPINAAVHFIIKVK